MTHPTQESGPELLACPFCDDPLVHIWSPAQGGYSVICGNGCGAEGPVMENEERAAEAWNRRADSAAGGAEGWQPIETAPIKEFNKDDWYMRASDELLLFASYPVIGHYGYTKHGKGRWLAGGFVRNPTHWQPLPAPPKEGE